LSGHDHCAEHIQVNTTNYFVNGIGRGCCYQANNIDSIPEGALKYLLANFDVSVDIDDVTTIEEGSFCRQDWLI
jgi:hypothetical protein